MDGWSGGWVTPPSDPGVFVLNGEICAHTQSRRQQCVVVKARNSELQMPTNQFPLLLSPLKSLLSSILFVVVTATAAFLRFLPLLYLFVCC